MVALFPLAMAACTPPAPTAERLIPDYRGASLEVLDRDDLVRVRVEMTNALAPNDVADYADCAVAGYAAYRGFGFARQVRTQVDEQEGVWTADAVYLISTSLPRGVKTIDAEVVAAACNEKGIPLT